MADGNSNPYQSPEAPIVPENTQSGVLTGTMLSYLKEASPWLRFLGILGYISFGIICLCTIILFITVLAGTSDGIASELGLGFLGAIGGVVILLVYGLMAVLVFFPAHFTYKFGAHIKFFFRDYSKGDLEIAFKNNKSLWLFYGILAIIYLAIIPITLIIVVILAVGNFI